MAISIHRILPRFDFLASNASGFEPRRRIFLDDGYNALHFLQPVLNGDPDAFFTNGDDETAELIEAAGGWRGFVRNGLARPGEGCGRF